MKNHYGMSNSTSSFFITGVYSFPNIFINISSGLIHFFSIIFSGPVFLLEAMNVVLLMD